MLSVYFTHGLSENCATICLTPTDMQEGDQQCQGSYCNATCNSRYVVYSLDDEVTPHDCLL